MIKNKVVVGYHSRYAGKLYRHDCCFCEDHRDNLVGYGNPPSCPDFQKENPGAGRMEMRTEAIPVAEVCKALGVDEKDIPPVFSVNQNLKPIINKQ